MTRANNGKIYAVMAAICYLVYVAQQVNLLWHLWDDYYYYDKVDAILQVIYIIMAIALVVTLLIGNKKGVIGAVGALCLTYIANTINESINFGIEYTPLSNWITIGVYAALLVIGILMLCGHNSVKKIWFIPGIVAVVGYGIYWYEFLFSWMPFNLETILDFWEYMLLEVSWRISAIFVGLWMMKNVGSATSMRVNEYIPNNTRAPYPSPTQVGASEGAYNQKVYCRNCGAEMQDNEKFCFKCGAAKEPNIANKVNANHQNL